MLTKIKNNPVYFGLLAASLLLQIVSLIVYLTTGIIHNFTESYSVGCIIFLVVAILFSGFTIYKRVHLIETIPFIATTIALILFIVVNLNYIVAVIRAIDVTSVNATFVLTIVFLVLALGTALATFCIKEKKQ